MGTLLYVAHPKAHAISCKTEAAGNLQTVQFTYWSLPPPTNSAMIVPQWKAQQKTRELLTEFGRFQDWWRLFFGEKARLLFRKCREN